MTKFATERQGEWLWIDGASDGTRRDKRGTFLHVGLNPWRGDVFLRTGDSAGRFLSRKEAKALRDILNEALSSSATAD